MSPFAARRVGYDYDAGWWSRTVYFAVCELGVIRSRPSGSDVVVVSTGTGKEAKCSQTGTRTRVCWVRASYPNHLDYLGSIVDKQNHALTKMPTPLPIRPQRLQPPHHHDVYMHYTTSQPWRTCSFGSSISDDTPRPYTSLGTLRSSLPLCHGSLVSAPHRTRLYTRTLSKSRRGQDFCIFLLP